MTDRRFATHPLTVAAVLTAGACASSETPTLDFHPDVDYTVSNESGEPNLFATPNGQLLMSWLERTAAGHALMVAARTDGMWSEPMTAYTTDRMFANWADFPSIAATSDGIWMVHWLERVDGGTYAYHARMSHSADRGKTWSEPVTVHDDTSPTEHGFLSMVPGNDGSMDMIWLDGRETGTADRGPMTIRGTSIDRSGNRGPERIVDEKVCDCCQTALVRTSQGLVAAYRDRSDGEIRDIAVRYDDNGTWSDPIHVGNDRWYITGCPVNGPSLAAIGDTVAISWFTAPERESRVQVAFSVDGGRSFGQPVRVDDGTPLGRVDIELLTGKTAVVSWLERIGEEAEVRVRVVPSAGELPDAQTLTPTSPARQSGFPRSARVGNQIFYAHRAMSGEVGNVRVLVATIGG